MTPVSVRFLLAIELHCHVFFPFEKLLLKSVFRGHVIKNSIFDNVTYDVISTKQCCSVRL